ncbi:MAG: hypothetical protein QOE68_2530 [Thermoanaerobaculia bacterium]|jgi:hypothetical protein|nr:hypothetical protein [Thermoanaerobaculia bacterium]
MIRVNSFTTRNMLISILPTMLPLLTRFVILLFAGYALYRLWRAHRSTDRLIDIVIAAGFLGRAIIGQLLFWISYARLPVARELQMGDGLWFFARDALEYFPTASRLASTGIGAIIDYPTSGASAAFVKVLAATVMLLGSVTSVAVLLNLFCYLGTMAVIVRWSEREPRTRLAATLAICAISLSPAFFLWSLQPLKDTFFQFIVIAFIGACAAWQRIWTSPRVAVPRAFAVAAAMTITLMAISGVRWYFAFALFVAAIIFLLLIASLSRRKAMAFAASAVLVVVLSRAFLIGGGPYVPTSIIRVMTPSTAIAEVGELPSEIVSNINMARDGFDRAGGRTSIHLGGSMSKLDGALGLHPATIDAKAVKPGSEAQLPIHKEGMDPAEVAESHPAAAAPVRTSHQKESNSTPAATSTTVAAAPAPSVPPPMASSSKTADAVPKHPETLLQPAVAPAPHLSPTTASLKTSAAPAPTKVASTQPAPIAATPHAAAAVTPNLAPTTPPPAVPATVAAKQETSAPQPAETSAVTAKRRAEETARPRPRVAKTSTTASRKTTAKPPTPAAVEPVKPAVSAPAPAPPVPKKTAVAERPASTTTLLLTGAASVVVPRSIGERLGLFHIGGGQGMFWFTELDTIIFDIILLFAILALVSRRSVSVRNPLVWFLALLTLLAGVPLAYAITNYGTLFRLREMIYIGMALTPLALATSWRRDQVVADSPDASPAP